MHLEEMIQQGKELIVKGKALGKDTTKLEEKVKSLEEHFGRYVPQFRLSQLAKLEIYSEILGCHIWLCSNEVMVARIKQDNPEAVCYTVNEMIKLMRLNPTSEDLRAIHNAKSVFSDSRIVNIKLQGESAETNTATAHSTQSQPRS